MSTTPEPPPPPNAGALRFEQGVVAIILLGGFVFRIVWVLPIVLVLLTIPLAFGEPTNVFARIYGSLFAPDTGDAADAANPAAARRPAEPLATTRFTRLVEVLLLALGTVFGAAGIRGLAWVFGLPVAAITAVAATTGINVVARLRDRFPR